MSLRDYLKLFSNNSSLRGVNKAVNNQSTTLRILWITYVLAMVIILLYGVITLTMEYTEFHTNIQINQKLHDRTAFPSITICSKHPFSPKVAKTWATEKDIISPEAFSRKLRQLMKQSLEKGEVSTAEFIFHQDHVMTYYQNVDWMKVHRLGYAIDELLVYCMIKTDRRLFVGEFHSCGLVIKPFSHPKMINCYVLEVNSSTIDSNDVSSVGLVISIGESPNITSKLGNSFIENVFNQEHGVRMVLGEPGVHQDVDAKGFNLGPGLYHEISYKVVATSKTNVVNDPCVQVGPVISDLDVNFTYSYHGCVNAEVGRRIRNRCKCIVHNYMRPIPSNVSESGLKYCGLVNSNATGFVKSQRCVAELHVEDLLSEIDSLNICTERCDFYTYESHVSSSKWLSTRWQLFWIQEIKEMWEQLKRLDTSHNSTKYRETYKDILRHLESPNITEYSDRKTIDCHDGCLFAMIRRTGSETIINSEKLALSFGGFISRIGGICSLTLGLTCAFLFEILEFCIVSKRKMSLSRNTRHEEHAELNAAQANHLAN